MYSIRTRTARLLTICLLRGGGCIHCKWCILPRGCIHPEGCIHSGVHPSWGVHPSYGIPISGGSKGGAPGACPPPPTDQNFLNFMQFFGKLGNNYMLAPLLEGWRPSPTEILDPPLPIALWEGWSPLCGQSNTCKNITCGIACFTELCDAQGRQGAGRGHRHLEGSKTEDGRHRHQVSYGLSTIYFAKYPKNHEIKEFLLQKGCKCSISEGTSDISDICTGSTSFWLKFYNNTTQLY